MGRFSFFYIILIFVGIALFLRALKGDSGSWSFTLYVATLSILSGLWVHVISNVRQPNKLIVAVAVAQTLFLTLVLNADSKYTAYFSFVNRLATRIIHLTYRETLTFDAKPRDYLDCLANTSQAVNLLLGWFASVVFALACAAYSHGVQVPRRD